MSLKYEPASEPLHDSLSSGAAIPESAGKTLNPKAWNAPSGVVLFGVVSSTGFLLPGWQMMCTCTAPVCHWCGAGVVGFVGEGGESAFTTVMTFTVRFKTGVKHKQLLRERGGRSMCCQRLAATLAPATMPAGGCMTLHVPTLSSCLARDAPMDCSLDTSRLAVKCLWSRKRSI